MRCLLPLGQVWGLGFRFTSESPGSKKGLDLEFRGFRDGSFLLADQEFYTCGPASGAGISCGVLFSRRGSENLVTGGRGSSNWILLQHMYMYIQTYTDKIVPVRI